MRRILGSPWLLVGLALFASGPARADLVTLEPIRDVTLYDSEPDKANGAGERLFAGRTDGSLLRRALLAFDVASAVPAGSTVNAVTLTLRLSRTQAGPEPVSVHLLLADWGEGTSVAEGQEGVPIDATLDDATWAYRFYDPTDPPTSPAWSADGAEGDYVVGASATTVVDGNGDYTWTGAGLVADVQAWLDGTTTDYGWMLKGDETVDKTAKRFDSRNNTNASRRPKLEIDFTPAATTGACCAPDGQCSVVLHPGGSCTGGVYQGEDTVCSPNTCPQPTGACCLPDAAATCNDLTSADCATAGGAFEGAGSACPVDCPVLPTPYLDPLPLPSPATPVSGTTGGVATYDLAMREVQQTLHSELPPTTVWGYGDGPVGATYPGPTIEASSGAAVTVNWINDLRDSGQVGTPLRTDHFLPVDLCPHGAVDEARTVVHLHGGHVPAAVDGHPEATFPPGQQVTYVYPNDQDAGTLWYHDHALGITRLNVQMGLAGFYLVRDATEAALGLPAGEFEIPLAIQGRSFAVDGQLEYPAASGKT